VKRTGLPGPPRATADDRRSDLLDCEAVIRSTASRYATARIDVDDLIQEGWRGALEAERRYDPDRGPFVGYASYWIRARIHRFAAANSHSAFAIPERVWNRANDAKRKEMSVSRAALSDDDRSLLALVDGSASLNQPVTESGVELGDGIPAADAADPSSLFTYDQVVQITSWLTPRERRLIELRYGLLDDSPRTIEEIGTHLGVTSRTVRGIHRRALSKMRLRIIDG